MESESVNRKSEGFDLKHLLNIQGKHGKRSKQRLP